MVIESRRDSSPGPMIATVEDAALDAGWVNLGLRIKFAGKDLADLVVDQSHQLCRQPPRDDVSRAESEPEQISWSLCA